jgi:hypothetical protein
MELDPDAFEAADLAEYGLPKLKELKEGILEALGECSALCICICKLILPVHMVLRTGSAHA